MTSYDNRFVRFSFVAHTSEPSHAQVALLESAFGLSLRTAHEAVAQALKARERGNEVIVKCSLEDFAVFLIDRNKLGLKNGFRELNAELVEVSEDASIVLDLRR